MNENVSPMKQLGDFTAIILVFRSVLFPIPLTNLLNVGIFLHHLNTPPEV